MIHTHSYCTTDMCPRLLHVYVREDTWACHLPEWKIISRPFFNVPEPTTTHTEQFWNRLTWAVIKNIIAQIWNAFTTFFLYMCASDLQLSYRFSHSILIFIFRALSMSTNAAIGIETNGKNVRHRINFEASHLAKCDEQISPADILVLIDYQYAFIWCCAHVSDHANHHPLDP